MKVRLIANPSWVMIDAMGAPAMYPGLWPVDRPIPEGYEELEIEPTRGTPRLEPLAVSEPACDHSLYRCPDCGASLGAAEAGA